MDRFVVPAPAPVVLPVVGSDLGFPVRRVYCVGRNYVAHIREMGGDEARDPPVFFQKPADSIVHDGATIPYPSLSQNYHHELELVVALKSGGRDIPADKALDHVYGYGIGLDMTRRDLQKRLSDAGLPWEDSKSFDHSCPCGPLHPVEEVGHVSSGAIRLTVNGETRQDSDVSLLIWKIPEIIANLSQAYELFPGDIILTGTPHGVGPVQAGDVLVGTIDKLGSLTVRIGPQR
ncbi:fumarylacetoacetate hydrolase family protein [Pseudoxanthobacter sp. M-2]